MPARPAVHEERNPAFWIETARHPEVRKTLLGLDPDAIGALIDREDVLPLASANGGFLFTRLDALGLVWELHSLFRPEGWGREVFWAGASALGMVFEAAQLLTTLQVQLNPRSQPPRSFGFKCAGGWAETPIGVVRAWSLARSDWLKSPGAKTCLSPRLQE
jgi:hypothetical protein